VEYERDRARYLAAAMIYYALVSLVPLLFLLLAALGLLLRFSTLAADVRAQVLLGIEAGFGQELADAATGLLDTVQQESIVATALGLAGVLFTASVLFRHLRLAFRALWKHSPPLVSGTPGAALRATLREYVVAFLIVLGGGSLLLGTLVLIAAAQRLGFLPAAAGAFVFAAIAFGALFKALPPVSVRWGDVWPATLLCAVVWVLSSELLALYGMWFADSRSAYGALGGLLAVMLWMSLVSKALFLGAELCKVTAQRRAFL
jgi:membrane protein